MNRIDRGTVVIVWLASLALTANSWADDPPSQARGTKRALLVCGLPGDDAHHALYAGLTEKIAQSLISRCGFEASNVWVRFGVDSKASDGPALKGSRGLSTRENIAAMPIYSAKLRRPMTRSG